MMNGTTTVDYNSIRVGLSELPRADNHAPGAIVAPDSIVSVPSHRSALDPDRALVVGNRGMGKSFWAHALADPAARERAAKTYRELRATDVLIGFNASERLDAIAPTPSALQDALRKCGDPEAVWRAVLVRVAASKQICATGEIPAGLADLATWVQSNGEAVDRLLTDLDNQFSGAQRMLVVVFDALDRLASDWKTTRALTAALLKRALAVRSFRSLRLKLFMRRDQFEDRSLFEFPDGSKIRNTRVELSWTSADLYTLLFARLSQSAVGANAFEQLKSSAGSQMSVAEVPPEMSKLLVDAIAGEYMGKDKKRGRIYTWLPLHLSDARGETAPRTFLTAWREAARHLPAPAERAIDHIGLLEGVRKASEDRLQELREDYWWIRPALAPLQGQMVPMDRELLEELWQKSETASTILRESEQKNYLAPIQLVDPVKDAATSLVDALASIGVVEIRSNGKINVPDIFRVEAGIKRKGGVKPPQRARPERV